MAPWARRWFHGPRRAFRAAFLVWLAAAAPAAAQTALTEHTLAAEPGAGPPTATLADAAWIQGHWVGEALGGEAEEVWLPAAGGQMPGMFRLVSDGEVAFYEIFTLVESGGTLVLRLKHFDPVLAGWEERDETVVFPLVDHDATTLWFDGLTMERLGPDAMTVWVAMEDPDGGVTEGEFAYRRR
ncbi:MAG: DUF6265 family protein [Gemmatimonadota bacterium]